MKEQVMFSYPGQFDIYVKDKDVTIIRRVKLTPASQDKE